jgi:hypothetical protein
MRHLRQNMARRRKNDDWIALVAQLGGLVVLLSLISPQARQALSAIGVLAFCLLGLIIVSLVGFCVYRILTRSQRRNAVERNVDWKTLNLNAEYQEPKTAPDLIVQLRGIDWFQFEKIVALTYRKLGYTVTSRGGANPDGGIDLIIEMAGQKSAIQCKHWRSQDVGEPAMRDFLGALANAGIQKGIFITLCGYTGYAKKFADQNGIELMNVTGLAKLLESTSARVDPKVLEILHDKRKFCPKCGAEMKLRISRTGLRPGQQFWGCSNYGPRGCKGKLPYQPRLQSTVFVAILCLAFRL